jgi:hypothetical protein
MTKSEPQQLGRNDASPPSNPGAYRTTPNLGESQQFPDMKAVKPEEIAHNNGTRTGRSE